MNRKNPNLVSEIDPESLKKVPSCLHDGLKRFIQVGPEKWCLLKGYEEVADELYNFEVRPDDVWIVGMPRSGTTMTEDMVWSPIILTDFAQCGLDTDIPVTNRLKISRGILFGNAAPIGQRRVIKTHLPISLLPPEILTSGCKIIYVARNPKDTMVSSFLFFANRIPQFEFFKTFEKYFELYINDLVIYTPCWKHMAEAWEKRGHPNFKFLFYENNSKYLKRTIEEVAEFLEVDLTADKLGQLENVMSFEEFKKLRPGYAGQLKGEQDILRKGKVGGYKEHMTEEMIQRADRWIEENRKKIGIDFPDL